MHGELFDLTLHTFVLYHHRQGQRDWPARLRWVTPIYGPAQRDTENQSLHRDTFLRTRAACSQEADLKWRRCVECVRHFGRLFVHLFRPKQTSTMMLFVGIQSASSTLDSTISDRDHLSQKAQKRFFMSHFFILWAFLIPLQTICSKSSFRIRSKRIVNLTDCSFSLLSWIFLRIPRSALVLVNSSLEQ